MWAIHISLQAQHRRAVCNLKHNLRTQQPHHSPITAWVLDDLNEKFKVQGSLLFVTYTIIQGIIGSEMLVGTGPLNGKCKKEK